MAASGFVVERHGFTSGANLAGDIITTMLANGFTQPGTGPGFNAGTATVPYKVTMEASTTVDPLNTGGAGVAQPWRVCIDVQGPETVLMYIATPLQLPDDGSVTILRDTSQSTTYYTDIVGNIGQQLGTVGTNQQVGSLSAAGVYTGPQGTGTQDEITKGLVVRAKRLGISTGGTGAGLPLSYRLVITPRGFWLGCWEDATTQQNATGFSWVLVQRPVDRTTGLVLTTGKAPVFCLSSLGGTFSQMVIRESDILRPGTLRSASENSEDSEAVLNIANQVSLSEDGKYIVTFPSRLNTSRYRYPHELDMLATTSADVVSQFSDVPLTVYGEGTARSYKAMQASGASNTGMRILVLQNGGGISGS